MKTVVLKSKVDRDGVLRLEVPMGLELADRFVDVAVAEFPVPETDEEKRAVIRSLAGAMTDPSFERQPQDEHRERDPL